MRILILGGNGMLGHKAWQILSKELDVYMTIRGDFSEIEEFGIFDREKTICGVDVLDFPNLEKRVEKLYPEAILNCVGVVKQVDEAHDTIKSIEINSLLPHQLARLCSQINARLIHLSTDCVFSGCQGNYKEADIPDPLDLYGRTKLLGEVIEGRALTIRTSIIGPELKTRHGLLEWFLSQEGKTIKGYQKAIFSGFSTAVLSDILKDIILKHRDLRGLYHVSSKPISKFDLLTLIKEKMKLDVKIIPDDEFKCDRSLDSSKFRREVAYYPPSWKEIVKEMAEEIKKGAR